MLELKININGEYHNVVITADDLAALLHQKCSDCYVAEWTDEKGYLRRERRAVYDRKAITFCPHCVNTNYILTSFGAAIKEIAQEVVDRENRNR